MKTPAFLRSLSMRLPARLLASPAVAPFPIRTPFDIQVTAELDSLHSDHHHHDEYEDNSCLTLHCNLLLDALTVSINTQKIALESLPALDSVHGDSDRVAINEYIDHNTVLLDACNGVSEKLHLLQDYVRSLRVVSHLLDGKYAPVPATLARAGDVLDSCEAMETSCSSSASSSLKKLLTKKKISALDSHGDNQELAESTQLREILTGSASVASIVCGFLGLALSLKKTCGSPSTLLQHYCKSSSTAAASWSRSLGEVQRRLMKEVSLVTELRETVKVTRDLRQNIKCKNQIRDDHDVEMMRRGVQELKRRCEELEEGIEAIEERVKELYKHLVYVRMYLLNILSHA